MSLSVFVWTLGDVIGVATIALFVLLYAGIHAFLAWEKLVRWVKSKFKP
jgi:hypothetical protein